jgi:hypothetical protein
MFLNKIQMITDAHNLPTQQAKGVERKLHCVHGNLKYEQE